MVKLRSYRLGATVTVTPKLRSYRLGMSTTAKVALRPIPTVTVEPQVTVNIVAVTAAGSSTPTSYTFTQQAGPPVTITPDPVTPSAASFPSPSVFPPNSRNVIIAVTGTLSGVTSAPVFATVTVLPQTDWTRVGSGDWVGGKTVQLS